ncbi:hypothetical protein Osc1_05250 [Hominimerdicola sp. 21CYCFAH17_S]
MAKSIYEKGLNIKGDKTISLTADERMMICNALANSIPNEVDPMPIIMLIDRIATNKSI